MVLLYASKYPDIHTVVNVSGRYDLKKGIEERLGEEFMQRIKKDGFVDVNYKTGILQCIFFLDKYFAMYFHQHVD